MVLLWRNQLKEERTEISTACSEWLCDRSSYTHLYEIGAVSGNRIIKINLLLHAFPVVR